MSSYSTPNFITVLRSPKTVTFVIFAFCAWILWRGELSQAASRNSAQIESGNSTQVNTIPVQLGSWVGSPIEVTDKVVDILETTDVVLMEYRIGDEPPLWFAQVSGFGNRAAFHPPELCYIGSNFQILEREQIKVVVGGKDRKLMRLVISQDGQRFEAWYWFTANRRVTANYYQQQLWLVLDSIKGLESSGTLVRISTTLDEPQEAHDRLFAFVETFILQGESNTGT